MFEKKILTLGDERLVVHTSGDAESCLIFLSGWGTPYPLADMYLLAKNFSERHQVLILQRFGYGDSAMTGKARTPEIIASEIKQVITKLRLDNKKITLVGHSIGGLYAYIFSALYPELCRQVILLDAVPFPKLLFYPNYAMVFYAKLLEKLKIVEKLSDDKMAKMIALGDHLPNQVRQTALDFGRKNPFNPVVVKELKPMIQGMDELYQKYLPSEKTSILSLARTLSYPRAEKMGKKLQDSCDYRAVNIGKAGHYIHLEKMTVVCSEIEKFLAKEVAYGKRESQR
jgi:pimeloyl-ACP methyl ester carboxylesterase